MSDTLYLPQLSNARARAELDVAFIPPARCVMQTADWLIRSGLA